MGRSVEQWLRWQESLHPRWMDLSLDRVRDVAARLALGRPSGTVFTVAGTNGKGSTVALLEQFLLTAGKSTGAYTSPHLVAYNERIRVGGRVVSDELLVKAFERVEAARGDTPLTFFEFGTLAALTIFEDIGCESWVLEVGLGGRLDAVNVVDPDYSLITTISLDHEEYLGDSVEAIAGEKAGILRSDRPAFYGDWPVPDAIRNYAGACSARLRCLGEDFDYFREGSDWSWRGEDLILTGLPLPPAATRAQLCNCSLVLACLEQFQPALLQNRDLLHQILGTVRPPGRFQVVEREHQWILDVAHNPQAAGTLRAQLETLAPADTTLVLGLLGDKRLDAFVTELEGIVNRWITCTVEDPRARAANSIAARLRQLGVDRVEVCPKLAEAFSRAQTATPAAGRIVVCGSFRVVGPAMQWLGIY